MSEFWTEADSAELDVLVNELVTGYFEHRHACRACVPNAMLPCPHVQRAIAVVVDWRDARWLLSRAEALRARVERAVS